MDAVTWNDALEIVIFWAGIYAVLRSLHGTRGLGMLKGGVGFVVGMYLVVKLIMPEVNINLERLTYLLESLATAALLAGVVIFQPEVRRGLTRLGERPAWLVGRTTSTSVSPIVEAAGRMSRRRIGALMVIERSIGIGSIIDSGVTLSADVSAQLLESVFYPNAPLHDGAVVIRGGAIVAASCLLPLSDDPDLGPEVGTRHRAAVGLSEECDALAVVVSEQTGRISIAYRGCLRPMRDIRELEASLAAILSGSEPEWVVDRAETLRRRQEQQQYAYDEELAKTAILHVEGARPDRLRDRDSTSLGVATDDKTRLGGPGEMGRGARSAG